MQIMSANGKLRDFGQTYADNVIKWSGIIINHKKYENIYFLKEEQLKN
jgi:hypothetical protein